MPRALPTYAHCRDGFHGLCGHGVSPYHRCGCACHRQPPCQECIWMGQEHRCAGDPVPNALSRRTECSKWASERDRMRGLT